MANDSRHLIFLITTPPVGAVLSSGKYKVKLINHRQDFIYDIEFRVTVEIAVTSSLLVVDAVSGSRLSASTAHSLIKPNKFIADDFELKKNHGVGTHRVRAVADYALMSQSDPFLVAPPQRFWRKCQDYVDVGP